MTDPPPPLELPDGDPDLFATLVDPDAEMVILGSGYEFSEGPVWSAADNALYFSDIPGDVRWKWTSARGLEADLTPTFKGNGMAYDLDGNLLVCEQVSSCLARFDRTGRREVIAYHYEGRYLNSPNDVVTRASDGGIYFTDPDYGRWNDWIGQQRAKDGVGYRGVYRLAAGATRLDLVVDPDEFDQPNGLCFSPDESLLYVNDSPRAHIKAFDVLPDGRLENGRLFFDGMGAGITKSAPDGMECDVLGNVWCSGPGGVWIVAPDGRFIGHLATPEGCGSLAWGGADLRDLFLTTTTTLRLVRTRVASALLPGNH